jgi:peptidoglycan L-alanyl-D-glutamate endopeptidase CwlK
MIVDSRLTENEALAQNPALPCPTEILLKQRCVEIHYISFDEQVHQGQIVVHQDIVDSVKEIFIELLKMHFPIAQVIPISDPQFMWDDETSMVHNNTSAFNYRTIAGSEKLSLHAYGRAIDINPLLNPYIHNEHVSPRNAVYRESVPGTIKKDSEVVKIFKQHGFAWGGDWIDCKDYQHFEKPL